MDETVKDTYKLFDITQEQILKFEEIAREIAELDHRQRLIDAQEEMIERGVQGTKTGFEKGFEQGEWNSAFGVLQEDLEDDHQIDLQPYREKLQSFTGQQLLKLRRIFRQESKWVIQSALERM